MPVLVIERDFSRGDPRGNLICMRVHEPAAQPILVRAIFQDMTGKMSGSACVKCFHNEGVQRLAEQYGAKEENTCQRCGSQGHPKLRQAEARLVMEAFFRDRSGESRLEPGLFFCGDRRPVDMFGQVSKDSAGMIERAILDSETAAVSTLEQTASYDCALLSQLAGLGLRLYAGRGWFALDSSWRLELLASLAPERVPAYEKERRDLSSPRPRKAMLNLITRTWPSTILRAKDVLYRARRSPSDRLNVLQYDSPPRELVTSGGRFNRINRSALYAAFDVETCLSEMKIAPEDVVNHALFIARLEALQDIRLLDLTLHAELLSQGRLRAPGEEQGDAEERYRTIASLTLPFDHDYLLTQALAEHTEESGYDGIIFSSAMRYAGGSFADRNVVIFGNPIARGSMRVQSLNVSVRPTHLFLR